MSDLLPKHHFSEHCLLDQDYYDASIVISASESQVPFWSSVAANTVDSSVLCFPTASSALRTARREYCRWKNAKENYVKKLNDFLKGT